MPANTRLIRLRPELRGVERCDDERVDGNLGVCSVHDGSEALHGEQTYASDAEWICSERRAA